MSRSELPEFPLNMLEAAEAGPTQQQLQLFVEEPTLRFGCDRFR